MLQTKTCALSTCRVEFQTDNSRKTHCTRQHATLDRVRRWKAKQRNGGGGGGNGGGGGGAPTLFDTIETVDPQAIYVPDTCYRTPLVRKPSLTERRPRLVAA
jgi:hypothetical protein